MRITLLGAAGGEVTGSAYLVETESANVLVDCGQFQGAKKLENRNRLPQPEGIRRLDAIVLTHAHLDHTGRLPLLARLNYRGPIFGTRATFELADLILRDSASLHKSEVARENRRRKGQRKPPLDLQFTAHDVKKLGPLFKRVALDRPTRVAPGVSVRLVEAGHIFGSASVEMTVEETGRSRVVLFSGDLGPRGAPLHLDSTPLTRADALFMESTYGDRNHRSLRETAAEAVEVIRKAIEANGKILVPTFAIGRTQILLYLLAGAFKRKTLPPFPIYVDSPMAIEATRIYRGHAELFDEEAKAMLESGELRAQLRSLSLSETPSQSRSLIALPGPCLIMAGSGMCTGGRILEHLRASLPFADTTVLMVGFQSRGSLGRALVDGATEVRIRGDRIPVRASIHTMGGLSGHAGQDDLLRWFAPLAAARPRLFLTHGEDTARDTLHGIILKRYGIDAERPGLYDVIEV